MQWPDYYPQCCPPDDAEPASGQVFRLVEGSTPTFADFQPYFLQQLDKYKGTKCECDAAGISLRKTIEDIMCLKRRVSRFKRHHIAQASLEATHGKIKSSFGSSHITWWVPVTVQPHTLFTVLP